jgi:hypothetical protein
MNLFLVVTSSQFQKTKRKEAERRKKLNNSLQNKENSEEGSCWEEFLKLLSDLIQKAFKKIIKICKNKDNKIQVSYLLHSYLFKQKIYFKK